MKVAIRGKNIEVTDALRAYIEKRLSKLTRYFDDELDAQAVLSVVKDKSTIELTCFVDKIVLRGVETNDDMYAAIDLVIDKIVRQIHKHKTRLAKRFKKQEAFPSRSFSGSCRRRSYRSCKTQTLCSTSYGCRRSYLTNESYWP